jgi:hypothetical protein
MREAAPSELPDNGELLPIGQVPQQYAAGLFLDINGTATPITPDQDLPRDLIRYARWISPPLIHDLLKRSRIWYKEAALAHPSCPEHLARQFLDRTTAQGMQEHRAQGMQEHRNYAAQLRIAIADNDHLPERLRRQALSQLLNSSFVLSPNQDHKGIDDARVQQRQAFYHPLSTTEMRMTATPGVLAECAGHWVGAPDELWQGLQSRFTKAQIRAILKGPATGHVGARRQLAKQCRRAVRTPTSLL